GLESGAEDFLTKPINDSALLARVRSLVRLKIMMDELRLRNQTGMQFGIVEDPLTSQNSCFDTARILIIDDDVVEYTQLVDKLKRPSNIVDVEADADQFLNTAKAGNYDVILVSTQLDEADGLRLCSQMRSQANLRSTPLVILIEEGEEDLIIKGLDMGVNDYLLVPVDDNELVARVTTQIKRKRYQDFLKANYEESISLAVKDSLTGLYNRRYFDVHHSAMLEQAQELNKPLTFMMVDIDHFKKVNDNYGHQAGDLILRQVAERMHSCLRSTDLVARYGGEEFIVITNAAPVSLAYDIADRISKTISKTPIMVNVDGKSLSLTITVSIGAATTVPDDTAESLLSRADKCVYQAKENGRNCIVLSDEIEELIAEKKIADNR
ncbi:MAG: diguanylate cyclase, partial [Rickettsiales bacterium]|nr:diguanylate cyclase [Rickettsiales bacterium]